MDNNIERINEILRTESVNKIEIGRLLKEVREDYSHGNWIKYVTNETGLTKATVCNYIRVYELTEKVKTFLLLDFSKLIELCKLNDEQIEHLMSKHTIEELQEMSVREFKKIIKPYLPVKEKKEKEPTEEEIPIDDEDDEHSKEYWKMMYKNEKSLREQLEKQMNGNYFAGFGQANNKVKDTIKQLPKLIHPDITGGDSTEMALLNSIKDELKL